MELNMELRLVFIIPTILFLIGSLFKGVMLRKCLNTIMGSLRNYTQLFNAAKFDFFFALAFEALFVFTANTLIIIFEMNQLINGIILLLIGIVFSVCLILGTQTRIPYAGVIGFFGVVGLLGGELAYFISFQYIIILGGIVGGIIVGWIITKLANIQEKESLL